MRPSLVLLVLGLLGIAWAMHHAFNGDSRCAERCLKAGYERSRYMAPYGGTRERCSCVRPDGTLLPSPEE